METTTTSNKKDQLISWLNNAHAMEMALVQVLENHARDARNLPHVQERIRAHIDETHQHIQRLRQAIALAGASVSSGKSWLGDIFGRINAISTAMSRDELVKNVLMDYASEHFEIASYKSLIAAAEELNFPEIVELCRNNLQEEISMARWLESMIAEVTRMHLQQQELRAAA